MASNKTFNFKLGDDVVLKSGERGTVKGRAHYTTSDPTYLVVYVAADGRLTECWWDESALQAKSI